MRWTNVLKANVWFVGCTHCWATFHQTFYPHSRKKGLITDLGHWIIENACRELSNFIARAADRDFRMHVNVSSLQLQQARFAEDVLGVMKRYSLQGHNMCIELTEGVLLKDT